MLGRLGFAPWQYGLAFGAPCVGGLIGSRLARPLVARFGKQQVMLIAGALRAGWSLWLAFIGPGAAGMVLVIAVELGLVTCVGVFNPVLATYRLEQTGPDRVARTLSAWSITSNVTIAAMTALWGLLASLTSPRTAIALAGLLMLTTPLLLPRRRPATGSDVVQRWQRHTHRARRGDRPEAGGSGVNREGSVVPAHPRERTVPKPSSDGRISSGSSPAQR
jgi:MFS family permease